jgi:hypothetical protein
MEAATPKVTEQLKIEVPKPNESQTLEAQNSPVITHEPRPQSDHQIVKIEENSIVEKLDVFIDQ